MKLSLAVVVLGCLVVSASSRGAGAQVAPFNPSDGLLTLSDLPGATPPWAKDDTRSFVNPPDETGFTVARAVYTSGDQRMVSVVTYEGVPAEDWALYFYANSFFQTAFSPDPPLQIEGPQVGEESQWVTVQATANVSRSYFGVAFIANGMFGVALMGAPAGEVSAELLLPLAQIMSQHMEALALPPTPTNQPSSISIQVAPTAQAAPSFTPPIPASAAPGYVFVTPIPTQLPYGSVPVTLSIYERNYCSYSPFGGCVLENVYQDGLTGTLYYVPSSCDYPAYSTPGVANLISHTLTIFPAQNISCPMLGP